MLDLSKKTLCVVDNGLFVSWARMLAPQFGRVLYYMPWQNAFPKSRQLVVGEGFPEIERVQSNIRERVSESHAWERLKDTVDLWAFTDVFHADLQWELVNEGRRVWGARDAEDLELYRWEARGVWKRLGLPVLPAKLFIGMGKLKAELRAVEDRYVKQSFTRGDFETFHHRTWQQSERRLEQMEYDLGPLKEDYEFIVESALPNAVEFGYDGACVDGNFLYPALIAPEVKGLCLIAKLATAPQELPLPVRSVNMGLKPEFARLKYRGNFSSEVRFGKDGVGYLLDPCCRLGSPSNELLQAMLGNWGSVMWAGAEGSWGQELLTARARWGVVVMGYSEDSGQNYQELFYPRSLDADVKVRNAMRVGTRNYAVPQGAPQNLCGVVGTGQTLMEAIAATCEKCNQVQGDHVDLATKSILDGCKVLEDAGAYGANLLDTRLDWGSVAKLVV